MLAISSQGFFPRLANVAGLAPATYHSLLGTFSGVIAVLVAVGGAALALSVGVRVVLLWMSGLSVVIAFVTFFVRGTGVLVPLGLLAALTVAIYVLLYALAGRAYPLASRASGVGVTSALGRAGGLLGPLVTSWLIPMEAWFVLLVSAVAITARSAVAVGDA